MEIALAVMVHMLVTVQLLGKETSVNFHPLRAILRLVRMEELVYISIHLLPVFVLADILANTAK